MIRKFLSFIMSIMRKQTIIRGKNSILVSLSVLLGKEGDYYIAYCPALDLSAYGRSEKEAKASFETSLNIFFEEAVKNGTLEKLLLRLGWTLRQAPEVKYEPPEFAGKTPTINMTVGREIIERVAIPVG